MPQENTDRHGFFNQSRIQSKQAKLLRVFTIYKFMEPFQPFCMHNEFHLSHFHSIKHRQMLISSVLFKKSSKIVKLGTDILHCPALNKTLTSTIFSSHLSAFKVILTKIRIVIIICFHTLKLYLNLPFLYSSISPNY